LERQTWHADIGCCALRMLRFRDHTYGRIMLIAAVGIVYDHRPPDQIAVFVKRLL
jgi:hypothetical protein